MQQDCNFNFYLSFPAHFSVIKSNNDTLNLNFALKNVLMLPVADQGGNVLPTPKKRRQNLENGIFSGIFGRESKKKMFNDLENSIFPSSSPQKRKTFWTIFDCMREETLF